MPAKIEEVEKRVVDLEKNWKVALTIVTVFGLTASGLMGFLWWGFSSAQQEVEKLSTTTQVLKEQVAELEKGINENLRPTIDRAKQEIRDFVTTQINSIAHETLRSVSKSFRPVRRSCGKQATCTCQKGEWAIGGGADGPGNSGKVLRTSFPSEDGGSWITECSTMNKTENITCDLTYVLCVSLGGGASDRNVVPSHEVP